MSKTPMPALVVALAFHLAGQTAVAAGFTDRAAFEAAIAGLDGLEIIENFEGLPADTLLASGVATAAVSFVYDLGGVQVQVREVSGTSTELATTSPPSYAGTDDGGVFQDGDSFVIDMGGAVNAVGLSFTSIDALEPADIVLSAPNSTIALDPDAVQSLLDDGAREFFLGVVESNAFSQVSLSTVGGGFFLYTIDDLTIVEAPALIFTDSFEAD